MTLVRQEGEPVLEEIEYCHGLTPLRNTRTKHFRRDPDLNEIKREAVAETLLIWFSCRISALSINLLSTLMHLIRMLRNLRQIRQSMLIKSGHARRWKGQGEQCK